MIILLLLLSYLKKIMLSSILYFFYNFILFKLKKTLLYCEKSLYIVAVHATRPVARTAAAQRESFPRVETTRFLDFSCLFAAGGPLICHPLPNFAFGKETLLRATPS